MVIIATDRMPVEFHDSKPFDVFDFKNPNACSGCFFSLKLIIPKKIKKALDKPIPVCYTIIRKRKEILKMISKIEDAVIRKYGFEHKITIAVFRVTEILRRLAE